MPRRCCSARISRRARSFLDRPGEPGQPVDGIENAPTLRRCFELPGDLRRGALLEGAVLAGVDALPRRHVDGLAAEGEGNLAVGDRDHENVAVRDDDDIGAANADGGVRGTIGHLLRRTLADQAGNRAHAAI